MFNVQEPLSDLLHGLAGFFVILVFNVNGTGGTVMAEKSAKWRSNWMVGACFRDCKHQGNKRVCNKCHRINGQDTEFEPKEKE